MKYLMKSNLFIENKKHLKTYEQNNDKLQIGDYVICKEIFINDPDLTKFLLSNIGKINDYNPYSNRNAPSYIVEYDNIPEFLHNFFYQNSSAKPIPRRQWPQFSDEYSKNNLITVLRKEIIHWSKNKEDLQIYIDADKYNL